MNKYCYGCGALLQTTDKKAIGYVPKIFADKPMLCWRCYRSIHHHEFKQVTLSAAAFTKMIDDNITRQNLIVLVIDLFDISSSFNEDVFKYLKNNRLLIVANKRDLILKNVNDNKIKRYLKAYAQEYSANVVDIIITSAQKNYHIDELLGAIFKYHNGYHVYFLGLSNVGKSSLVNAILQSQAINEQLITVSNFLNTTLEMIEIPLLDNVSLLDMPGLNYQGQMIHYLKVDDLKYVDTKKEIKARTYQLEPRQSVYLGGLACFSYVAGQVRKGFTFYLNNPIALHRAKYDESYLLYDKHRHDELLVPKACNVMTAADFVKHHLIMDHEARLDIIIAGLGWISFKANANDEIILALPPHVGYTIRKALLNG